MPPGSPIWVFCCWTCNTVSEIIKALTIYARFSRCNNLTGRAGLIRCTNRLGGMLNYG